MPLKRGLCFDLDGTILDSVATGPERFVEVSRRIGLPVDSETINRVRAVFGKPTDKLIMAVWPGLAPEIFIRAWQKLEVQELLPMISGALETLTKLNKEFLLSILTNRDSISTDFQIGPIKHFFRFVITHDNMHCFKPDPKSMAMVFRNYEIFGTTKENIIYVGDNVNADFGLARITGTSFYAVTSGVNTFEEFLNAGLSADRILNSIADLPKILGIN